MLRVIWNSATGTSLCRFWLTLTLAVLFTSVPKTSLAQSCFPECRNGFRCENGACVAESPAPTSADCFPACRSGFHCVTAACVADVAASQANATAPAAQSGHVKIVSFERAKVFINNGLVGVTTPEEPLSLTLPGGLVDVGVVFDGGGKDRQRVMVLTDREQSVEFLSKPSSRAALDVRVGHWMFGAGGSVGGGLLDEEFGELRLQAYGVFGYGLSGAVDFQVLPSIAASVAVAERDNYGTAIQFGLEPRLIFHLGSVYTMSAGLNLFVGTHGDAKTHGYGYGANEWSDASHRASGFDVRLSPVGFQFGQDRDHYIELFSWLGGDALRTTKRSKSIVGDGLYEIVEESSSWELRLGGGVRYTVLFKHL